MFSEQDRKIFGPYFNGLQMVFADPLAVHRRLVHELEGDPNYVLKQAKSEVEAERFQAREQLLTAARVALGMVPFDPTSGQGALEPDVWTALNSFLAYLEKKNPSPVSLPTSVQPTGLPPFSVPLPSPDGMGIPPTSVSSSPFHGCGCGVPGR